MKQIQKTIAQLPIVQVSIIFFVSLLVLGSSPLFKTNPWVDSNAMLTMGRSMLAGAVPFRDVIDQRGPIIYAIYAFGALIKNTSFLGIFFIQFLNLGIVYWLTVKIASDFKDLRINPTWLGLLGPLALISTSAFSMSGSPEEFGFTSVLYLIYIIVHYNSEIREIPLVTFLFLGLNLSYLFWIKYSMIGAFVLFFIATAIILTYQQEINKLLKVVFFSVLGFSILSFFVFIYFACHHAISDLIQIYFVQNMTSYGKNDNPTILKLWQLLFLIAKEITLHYMVVILIVIGWILELRKKKNIMLEVVIFLGAIIFVAAPHWIIDYYNLIWMPFLVVALIRVLDSFFEKVNFNQATGMAIKFLLIIVLIGLPFVNNKDLEQLVPRKSNNALNGNTYVSQLKFADEMKKRVGYNRIPSLLMINTLDSGFFLTAHSIPTTRYWHKLNMSYDQLPQMYDSFNQSLRQKKTDFVIVRVRKNPGQTFSEIKTNVSYSINDHLRDSLFKNYTFVDSSKNNNNEYFVLMQKNDSIR